MKKNYLKLIALLAIISISSTKTFAQFPEWSYGNVGTDSVVWYGVDWGLMDPEWATDFMADGKLTLNLDYYPGFDMENEDVSDVWDMLETAASPVDKYLDDESEEKDEKRLPDNADDFSAEIKGFYDNDDVYILIKATDNEIIPGQESIELMWASYADYLPQDEWPFTPRATEDNEHVIARWGSMGSGKALANLDFVDTIPINIEAGFYFQQVSATADDAYWTHSWTAPDWDEDLGMKVGQFKQTGNTTWEAIWKFNIDKTLGGLVGPEKDVKFSFDLKVIDRDTLTRDKRIEALFSSTDNDVWWSTYYAGYAMFTEDTVGVINNAALNNISVYPNPTKNELFVTQEVAKIEVFNLLGAKVKEVNKLGRKVSLSGLKKGIYIVNTTDLNKNVSSFKVIVE